MKFHENFDAFISHLYHHIPVMSKDEATIAIVADQKAGKLASNWAVDLVFSRLLELKGERAVIEFKECHTETMKFLGDDNKPADSGLLGAFMKMFHGVNKTKTWLFISKTRSVSVTVKAETEDQAKAIFADIINPDYKDRFEFMGTIDVNTRGAKLVGVID